MHTSIRHDTFISVEMTESQARMLRVFLTTLQEDDCMMVCKRFYGEKGNHSRDVYETLKALSHAVKPPGDGESSRTIACGSEMYAGKVSYPDNKRPVFVCDHEWSIPLKDNPTQHWECRICGATKERVKSYEVKTVCKHVWKSEGKVFDTENELVCEKCGVTWPES